MGQEKDRCKDPHPIKTLALEEPEESTMASNMNFQLVTETAMENVMQNV